MRSVVVKGGFVLFSAVLRFMIIILRQMLLFRGQWYPRAVRIKIRIPASHHMKFPFYAIWGWVEIKLDRHIKLSI